MLFRSFGGYNLHAGAVVRAGDREGLARLARYALRGPLAKERVERRGAAVVLGMKRAWSDGTRERVMTPSELVERLVLTVPPPRAHTVLYHGVFGPAHRWRERVLPTPPRERARTRRLRRARILSRCPHPENDGRHAWAEALRRTFEKDGWACPHCG